MQTHDPAPSTTAPCVTSDLLSLAICKPRIRCGARIGDLIFGFAASSLARDHRLIYIARVTRVEPNGRYYDDETYSGRGDRIYVCADDGRLIVRTGAVRAARLHEVLASRNQLLDVDKFAHPHRRRAAG